VATINLDAVSRWYGNVVAVNGITMSVGPGVTGLARGARVEIDMIARRAG